MSLTRFHRSSLKDKLAGQELLEREKPKKEIKAKPKVGKKNNKEK